MTKPILLKRQQQKTDDENVHIPSRHARLLADYHTIKPTDLDAGVVGVRLASRWVGEQNVLGFEVPVDYAFGL